MKKQKEKKSASSTQICYFTKTNSHQDFVTISCDGQSLSLLEKLNTLTANVCNQITEVTQPKSTVGDNALPRTKGPDFR